MPLDSSTGQGLEDYTDLFTLYHLFTNMSNPALRDRPRNPADNTLAAHVTGPRRQILDHIRVYMGASQPPSQKQAF